MHPATTSDRTGSSTALQLLAAVVTAGITVAAIFLLGRATGSVVQHGAAVAGFAAVALLALWFGLRDLPSLRAWAVGGLVVTLVGALALGGLLSKPRTVDEKVISADVVAADARIEDGAPDDAMDKPSGGSSGANVLEARGSFEPLAHAGKGTASIIRTADGVHVLTLTGFETDPGPDLQVWLVAGNPSSDTDVEGARHVNLGALKGTSGDQQYEIPKGTDPSEFTDVYIWCRAFSVGFTRAAIA